MNFAFVFPGQGSQSVGMMRGYGEDLQIRSAFVEAAEHLNRDLWKLVTEGPAEELNLTTNTQPVMLAAGVAVYRMWQALGGPSPRLVAGHSLGEYSALVASGALAFSDALRAVQVRSQAMQEAVPAGEGGIAAVLGLDDAAVIAACEEARQGLVVEAANFNSPGQLVISGHRSAVERAMEIAKAKGAKRAVMLPMSVPAHSSLMRPAAVKLKEFLGRIRLSAPAIPVLHNADVATHSDQDEIKQALEQQVYSPVRWVDTIQALAKAGVTNVIECGPGKVLAGLTKRIDANLQSLALADAAGLKQAKQLLAAGST